MTWSSCLLWAILVLWRPPHYQVLIIDHISWVGAWALRSLMVMWCHRKKGMYIYVLFGVKIWQQGILSNVWISYVWCNIVIITVSKQSGSTVKEKDVHIDQVSMFSWFSTWPLFALWRHHRLWRRQRMPNLRRSSISKGMSLNFKQHPLLTSRPW